MVASKRNSCFINTKFNTEWKHLSRFSSTYPFENVFLALNLFSRLTRSGIHTIRPIVSDKQSFMVVAQKRIYLLTATGEIDVLAKINRGRRPLRRGISVVNQNIFFGDYWQNPNREVVNIYKVNVADRTQKIFYQFPQNAIRHIHTVDLDPYSKLLWVSTGDENSECMIGVLNPDTGDFNIIGQGSQKWRVVSFAFRPDAVYWGTDSHSGKNQIWCYDRQTQAPKKIGDVIGPVYYNTSLDDYIVFGTAMEKGEGEQDNYGRLYALDIHTHQLQEIWRLKKDRWSARYFGYGIFHFAEGNWGGNHFWVTPTGFEGGLRSILFELNDD